MTKGSNGPLIGIKVVEMAGIGPGPFCGMMLGDMGADIIAVDRGPQQIHPGDPLQRNRERIALDLKTAEGRDALMALVDKADVLFEGFRPGVAEKLGFGPDTCLARNPKLVYGRMTGWGQHGPLAQRAGHDINYIGITGALAAMGRSGDKPTPPLNLLGDFGGGGMLLAYGIVCALFEAQRSGKGQVVDAAIVDGTISMLGMFLGFQHMGYSPLRGRGSSWLSGAAHYYDTYETADGKFVAVGSLESQFYDLMIEKTGVSRELFAPYSAVSRDAMDQEAWGRLKGILTEVFKTKTRDEWCKLMEGSDACVTPVLELEEAPSHPHNLERGAFVQVEGWLQNAPAPRFSRTPSGPPQAACINVASFDETLRRWGFEAAASRDISAANGYAAQT